MPKIFIGVFAIIASSWAGLVAYPYFKLGGLQPLVSEETGGLLPPPMSGNAIAGQRVYAANGCVICHSQQVRPAPEFMDIARGWGDRQTVARDYLREHPAFTGVMRTGPDLSNIGVRQTDASWYYEHLYEPDVVTPGSIMPAYRFLFHERKVQGQTSELALNVRGPNQPKPGYEIVPTQEARELVAYLLSLKRNYPLPEAPKRPEGEE